MFIADNIEKHMESTHIKITKGNTSICKSRNSQVLVQFSGFIILYCLVLITICWEYICWEKPRYLLGKTQKFVRKILSITADEIDHRHLKVRLIDT